MFECLDDKATIANMLAPTWGWRKGDEFWVRPATWQEQLCATEFDPQEMARTLKDLDLLRTQDSRTFQCCVKVQGKTERAYVVSRAILEWKPAVTYARHNGHTDAGAQPLPQFSPRQSGSPALIPTARDDADLATRLERGVSRALDEALDILNTKVGRDDKAYQAILRVKGTIVNTLIGAQIRVDEGRLRAREADKLLPALLESLKIEKARLAKVDFRRGFLNGEPIGMGVETALDDEPSA
jgi:hypothetical protein